MINVSVTSVTSYPGVSSAMNSAGITADAVEMVIADAIAQAIVIAPELETAEGAHADGAAAIIRPAVARWITRSASGGGRQKTATAGSFSINESSSEAINFFELSEERKLSELGRAIAERSTGAIQIVDPGMPSYVYSGPVWI